LIDEQMVHAPPESLRYRKIAHLTMRLSDAAVRRRETKLI
jgi:hypothetical protein